MDSSRGAPPNVLVVVLDCARADDFSSASNGGGGLPFISRLMKESEVYPRTVATAPWTIPSHASLFTGLYPWEHGCHAKSALRLDPARPRLAGMLRSAGYRTMSLSANHLICPDLGFTEGFDQSAWAGWWEPYLRIEGVERPPNVTGATGGAGEAAPALVERSGALWGLIKRASRLAYRYPFVLDGAGRIISASRTERDRNEAPVSPWIEPTLGRWLARTPPDQPVFAFVNLLETHEPYYPDRALAPGLASWIRYSSERQDHVGWLSGRWEPTSQQYAQLRELYRRTFPAADRRVERIVAEFQRSGRWDNTLLVLTSDHGQAFGEQGILFHMLRLSEALTRVPLLVRRPGGEHGPSSAAGWASLVDVAPTVLDAVGRPGEMTTSGRVLGTLLDGPRADPVYAVADGLVWKTIVPEHERANFSERRKREFDRILACAYTDERKIVVDPDARSADGYDLTADPLELRRFAPPTDLPWQELLAGARHASEQMLLPAPTESAPDVEERLRSWGYI